MIRHSKWYSKKKFLQTLLFLSISFFVGSCDVINPAEPVPAYLQADSVSLFSNTSTQGSALSNFTDGWVYLDGNYLGAFEMPFTVPVLAEGNHKISIRAGIMDNGISGTRVAYSKTGTYDTLVNLKSNETISLSPQVNYLNGTVFTHIEDFDDGSLTITGTTANNATLIITPGSDPNALEGNSGFVQLDANNPVFEYAATTAYSLPLNIPVYAELNYKCTQEITVGLFITSTSGIIQAPLVNIRPSSTWKKIYINLSDAGGIFASAINYKIYLRSTLPAGLASGEIYLDNLKVLY